MHVKISFSQPVRPSDSSALTSLGEEFRKCGLECNADSQPSGEGAMDSGLTFALTIAGLLVSSIGTVVSLVAFWKQENKYKIRFRRGALTLTLEDPSAREIAETIRALNSIDEQSDIFVEVAPVEL